MDNKNLKKVVGIVLSSGIAFASTAYAQNQTNQQPATDKTINNNQTGTMGTTKTDQTTTSNRNAVIPDQELKSKAEQALQEYSGQVKVVVNDGVVFLSGELPSDTDYERVVVLTESIKGSQDVNADNLTVTGSTQPMTDTYITSKVRGSLIRTDLFDTNIPSWSIGVETKDGKVFLSGKVSSDAEKQKILEVVKSIKQVKGVDDQMIISQDTSDTNGEPTTPTDTTVDDNSDQTGADTNKGTQNNVQQ